MNTANKVVEVTIAVRYTHGKPAEYSVVRHAEGWWLVTVAEECNSGTLEFRTRQEVQDKFQSQIEHLLKEMEEPIDQLGW